MESLPWTWGKATLQDCPLKTSRLYFTLNLHLHVQKDIFLHFFPDILDNVVLNSPEPDACGGPVEKFTSSATAHHPQPTDEISSMSMAAIQEILKKTSQTISDIDNFCDGAKM
jgi:hypothetical protein